VREREGGRGPFHDLGSNACPLDARRWYPWGWVAVICGVDRGRMMLGGCGVCCRMPRPAGFTVRLLVFITLGAVMCGHGNCDEERSGGLGQDAAMQDLHSQLKVREDYIKALEERVSRLERVMEDRASSQPPGGKEASSSSSSASNGQGRRDAGSSGHQSLDEQEDPTSMQNAEIWRRARDRVRTLSTSSSSSWEASNAPTVTGDVAVEHRRSGHLTDAARLASLELSVGGVNVTSLSWALEMLKKELSPMGSAGRRFDSGDTGNVYICIYVYLYMYTRKSDGAWGALRDALMLGTHTGNV
jgi:hypothetical protein